MFRDIKNMYENHRTDKRLVAIRLYKLIGTFRWDEKLLDKKIIKIDKYYLSSRECNRCGYINKVAKDVSTMLKYL